MHKGDSIQEKDGISAVVCCHNSAKVIEPTIKALLNQNFNSNVPYEIIVVDNNCSDNTEEKVKHIYNGSKNSVDLTIIKEPNSGLANARRTGVLQAKYSIISFLDDDNIVNENWIEKTHQLFQTKPDVGVVGGLNQPLIQGNMPLWFERFQKSYACGKQGVGSSYITERKFVFGAGSSFRKSILTCIYRSELPLYLTGRKNNALAAGEDSELCHRAVLMGWEIWYEESLILYHKICPERLNWRYLCKLQEGHSYALIVLGIYRSLIDGYRPESLQGLLFKIIFDWIKLLKKYKKRQFKEVGSMAGIGLYHLIGLSRAWLKFALQYRKIKAQIMIQLNHISICTKFEKGPWN